MKGKGLTSKQMSRLYNRLRNQGKSKSSAFSLTGKAKSLSKRYAKRKMFPGKMKGPMSKLDFDGDRKVNKYDCYPFNKYRQDAVSRSKYQTKLWNEGERIHNKYFDEEADVLTFKSDSLENEFHRKGLQNRLDYIDNQSRILKDIRQGKQRTLE